VTDVGNPENGRTEKGRPQQNPRQLNNVAMVDWVLCGCSCPSRDIRHQIFEWGVADEGGHPEKHRETDEFEVAA
jgi:hypothetical protein